MDRLSATRHPGTKPAGTQRWRDLLFLHWEVDESVLRPLVPSDLTLDSFDGRFYVGLVPFAMLGVKPWWLPEFLSLDFLETNLRTYVHHQGKDPGVYFFSLDAASPLAVAAARQIWGLPYFNADMSLTQDDAQNFSYRVRRCDPRGTPSTLQVTYAAEKETATSLPGTLEHFLFERYLLFAERRGALLKGQVHHSPYPVALAELAHLEESLLAASAIPVTGGPSLCHYSPGVNVEVFGPHPVDPSQSLVP